eukprot:3090752-Amphidinium_carterae.1
MPRASQGNHCAPKRFPTPDTFGCGEDERLRFTLALKGAVSLNTSEFSLGICLGCAVTQPRHTLTACPLMVL